MSSNDLVIDENLILIHVGAEENGQVLRKLSNQMYENGFVRESFCDAIMEREQQFPTGLDCGKYNVAIPHTQSIHVNRTCIGVATLLDGVAFRRMDDPDESIDVTLVLMFASAGGHEHFGLLSSITKMIQNEAIVKQIVASEDKQEILQILQQNLVGG